MKQKEISLNIHRDKSLPPASDQDDVGDDHFLTSWDTPLRPDAFDISEDEKIKIIEGHFKAIMHTLGLDLTDDSLRLRYR